MVWARQSHHHLHHHQKQQLKQKQHINSPAEGDDEVDGEGGGEFTD